MDPNQPSALPQEAPPDQPPPVAPPPPVVSPPPKPPRWRPHLPRLHWPPSRRVVVAVTVLIAVLIIGGIIFSIARRKPQPAATNPKTGQTHINDQSLDPNIFKNFLDSNGLTQNNPATLVVGTNTIFNGTTTMHGSTILQGTTSIDGPANVSGNLTLQSGLTVASGLQVSGASTLSQLGITSNLNVGGTTNLQGNVVAAQGLTVRGNLSVLGSANVNTLTATTATVSGQLTLDGHFATGGSTPGVTTGIGAGGGSATIRGNDTAGTVIIETGNPSLGGTLATVTFTKSFGGVPHVVLSPDNMAAGKVEWYATRASSFFTIESESPAPAGSSLTFDYFVTQ